MEIVGHNPNARVRVVELDRPHRLAWRWCQEPSVPVSDTNSTLVEWTLTATAEGGTLLELRESGFSTGKQHEENSGGWDEELAHLVAHLGSA